jgi:hypothetical protein
MNNELMLYVLDCGWAGMIVVIARNEEDARSQMRGLQNYSEGGELEILPITEGLVVYNYGDL